MIADEPGAAGALGHFVEQLAGTAVRNRQFPVAPLSDVKALLAEVGAEVGSASATAVDHSASEFCREPVPALIASALVDALATNRIPGQARELALTPLGGAYNRVPADATAFVHRGDQFLLEWTVTSDPAQPGATRQAASQWLSRIRTVLEDTEPAAATRTSPSRASRPAAGLLRRQPAAAAPHQEPLRPRQPLSSPTVDTFDNGAAPIEQG